MNAIEKIMYLLVKILLLVKEVILSILRLLRLNKAWKKLMSLKKLYRIIILVIVVSLFIGSKSLLNPPHMEEVKVVETHKASKGNLTVTTKLLGKIEAKHYFTAKAGMNGNISYLAESGTKLAKGELIANLDSPEIKAQYETALASAKIARSRYEREKKLLKAGASSKHSVEQKYIELANAESSLVAARANYGKAYFEAPFEGTVGAWIQPVGAEVKRGDVLGVFYNPYQLIVKFNIPSNVAAKLSNVATIKLYGKEYSTSYIQKALSENSYTVPAHAEIECSNCIIGEAVYLDLQISKKEDAIVVPDSCVFISNGKRAVYKVKDGKAELQMVQVGDKQERLIEILEGVEEGDIIISAGQGRLYPGISIKIFEDGK